MHVVQAVAVEGKTPGRPGYFRVLLSNGSTVTLPNAFKSLLKSAMKKNGISPDPGDTKTGDCDSNTFRLNEAADGYPVLRTIIVNVDYEGLAGVDHYFTSEISGGAGTGYALSTYVETPSGTRPRQALSTGRSPRKLKNAASLVVYNWGNRRRTQGRRVQVLQFIQTLPALVQFPALPRPLKKVMGAA
jgi:hypothetical protein